MILLISYKKADFDNELKKKLNKNVTSNKIKHVLVENELNELSEKVKAISTKRLTKDLINKFSIINDSKDFYSVMFQNYSIFIPGKNTLNGMSEGNIENTTKPESKFSLTFVDHHVLPDINFNGHFLIHNNISISKK